MRQGTLISPRGSQENVAVPRGVILIGAPERSAPDLEDRFDDGDAEILLDVAGADRVGEGLERRFVGVEHPRNVGFIVGVAHVVRAEAEHAAGEQFPDDQRAQGAQRRE